MLMLKLTRLVAAALPHSALSLISHLRFYTSYLLLSFTPRNPIRLTQRLRRRRLQFRKVRGGIKLIYLNFYLTAAATIMFFRF